MGLFNRLFGKHQDAPVETAAPPEPVACPHTSMTPRWDRAEDIGHEDRATAFHCESCGQTFTAAEARELQQHTAERLRETLSVN